MKYKHFLLIVCILLFGISTVFGQNNTLSIPDVSVAKGKTICLPVNLDNTADVVAVQFVLVVPNGISINASAASLSERSDEHSLTFKSIGANRYMAMIFSSKNKAIKGRTGTLLSVPLTASNALDEGSTHPLTLSEVVIGAKDGSNMTTGFSAGKVTIAKSPDLEVSQVEAKETQLVPGGNVAINWTVNNIGGLPTNAGWSEQILLKNKQGSTKLLGTLYYDGKLNAGGVVSRNAEITIPNILGMDGNCHIEVKLVPNSYAGEPSWLQGNNVGETANALKVSKKLWISPESYQVDEANTKSVRFQLSRSGDITQTESFGITQDEDTRISLPQTITIEKGNSSTYFYAQIVPNGKLDNDSLVNINVTGNNYPESVAVLHIEDDTFPSLSISTDVQDVTEGGSIKFTVSTQRASKKDIQIKMTTDYASRFRIPENIVIPAGKTSVDVMVDALDDETPHAEEVVTFTVNAAGHNAASLYTTLVDNDVPTLEMEISPKAISEAAGPLSITAKIRRINNIDKVVTIKLSDDSNGCIYYGQQTITLDKGVEEATVNLGPIDNAIVDGERTFHISAAVWIASCSCNVNNAESGGVVTVPLRVYDNDGPTLTLTSAASVLKEGGEMTLTVKRNTATTQPLTVTISSDHDTNMEYPSSITIPAGSTESEFTIKSKGNDITGDGFTVELKATSEGFATGNVWFAVSDQTLPDAMVQSITAVDGSYVYGEEITLNATLLNGGNASLPAGTLVRLYESGSQEVLAEVYTDAAIPAGQTKNMNICAQGKVEIGEHSLYVKVNPNKDHAELDYNNNASTFLTIHILSPFSTSTKVSKSVFGKGEDIEISGKASGHNTANTDIDVYIINKGYRHVITTKTDAQGEFAVTYKPFDNQYGHFVVGSCFHNDKVNTEQNSFDIYGMDVKNSSLTCDVNKGESFTGSFELTNAGTLPLKNVKPKLMAKLSNAEVTLSDAPININGGETKKIAYTIKGIQVSPKLVWQTVKVSFTSEEGATATSDINLYIREPNAQMKANIASINTSVTLGSEREYHITLSNVGKTETGDITFSTPSWMHVEGIQTLSSLAMGESKEVALIISTSDKMQANVPVTGNIAVNCEHGNGISIPFNIEPVSSAKGVLAVDVCDEFTYYTKEAPHVAGAEVVVKHPTTGKEIATGTTNANGIFDIELPEGYYTLHVSANKHQDETINVYVDPERTRKVVVNMGYTAITYKWNVEETEIEDRYKLVTKVEYETNVPKPVVVLGVPEKIDGDNMKAGESTLVYITATNKGLVTAKNNQLVMPENTDEWKFEPLVNLEATDLPAQQTIVVPVRITRLQDAANARKIAKAAGHNLVNNFNSCMTQFRDDYEALCGDTLKKNESIERMGLKMCAAAATGATILDYVSGFFGAGGGSGLGTPAGGSGGDSYSSGTAEPGVVTEKSWNMCDPCDAKKAEDLFNVLIGKTFLGPVNDALDTTYELAKNKEKRRLTLTSAGLKILAEQLFEAAKNYLDYRTGLPVSDMYGFGEGIWQIINVTRISSEPCPDSKDNNQARIQSRASDKRGWQKEYDEVASMEADYLENFSNILTEIFGDSIWIGTDMENKLKFAEAVTEKKGLTEEDILAICPSSVTTDQAIKLYKRLNGLDDNNIINADNLDELIAKNKSMDEAAVGMGYESLSDRFLKAYNVCAEKYKEKSSSVCASITLQFTQKMVMTRQAFRGTLTVFNGNESTAMKDVKLALTVKDENGNIATSHEFQINPESLKGFTGKLSLEDGWTLDALQTGEATIMFIPTKYAAPTSSKYYSFGGSLSYVDPFTGLTITRDLAPVTLTVKPSPNLDLTYFMQRDIKGDDPLTEEVEPSEEAEFSLLINNTGYGDATNVRMYTDQPEIIENEKGLKIDFELMNSQLNGSEKTLALGGIVATDFGTIPAKSTAYAQWWIKSSLLGHFIDYNVEATHLTSYGNPDLSLLDHVNIHELIRSLEIEQGKDKLVGFMTNDIVDANDTPDMLYLSNGDIEPVSLAQISSIQKVSETDYAMTVSADKTGWNYGNVTDPTYGLAKLKSVVRKSDGKQMPLRNFWQTDRTLRDGKDPLYENRIHFADNIITGNSETYVLTFEPTPDLKLDVASIEGIPEEGSIAKEPLNQVKVTFNKYVEASSFTTDDISMAVQGVKQDVRTIGISTDDDKTFILDLTAFNKNVGNGYFVLTVNTSDVKDKEGYLGKNGKQAGWIMFRDGLVALSTSTYPINAGTVRKVEDSSAARAQEAISNGKDGAEYGSVLRLTTDANEGYEFKNWTVNGEVVSTDKDLEYQAIEDMDVKANYALMTYHVTVDENIEGGEITGSASGIYNFGDELQLTAKADEDYVFDSWTINGKKVSKEANIALKITEEKNIKATFQRAIFPQSLTLSRGWNWISTYVSEPIPVSTFLGNVTRIVCQNNEVKSDAISGVTGSLEALQPGQAYKMEASFATIKSFKGHLQNTTKTPIELHAGWNWISYPCNEEKGINDVLTHATEGDYLTSQYGFSEFSNGYWEGTLDTLIPGYGYIYKSGSDKVLIFDFSDKETTKDKTLADLSTMSIDAHKYPSTMNMIAHIEGLPSNVDNEHCRIYAFAGNECRGESQYVGENHYLTIYGDDVTSITFVVENTNNGDTYMAKESMSFESEVIGSRRNPFTIDLSSTTGINGSYENSSRKMRIYSIEGMLIEADATAETLKKLRRGIYVIDNQKVVVK